MGQCASTAHRLTSERQPAEHALAYRGRLCCNILQQQAAGPLRARMGAHGHRNWQKSVEHEIQAICDPSPPKDIASTREAWASGYQGCAHVRPVWLLAWRVQKTAKDTLCGVRRDICAEHAALGALCHVRLRKHRCACTAVAFYCTEQRGHLRAADPQSRTWLVAMCIRSPPIRQSPFTHRYHRNSCAVIRDLGETPGPPPVAMRWD